MALRIAHQREKGARAPPPFELRPGEEHRGGARPEIGGRHEAARLEERYLPSRVVREAADQLVLHGGLEDDLRLRHHRQYLGGGSPREEWFHELLGTENDRRERDRARCQDRDEEIRATADGGSGEERAGRGEEHARSWSEIEDRGHVADPVAPPEELASDRHRRETARGHRHARADEVGPRAPAELAPARTLPDARCQQRTRRERG